MILKYYYWAWNKAINDETCDRIKSLVTNYQKSSIQHKHISDSVRNSKVDFTKEQWLYDLIMPYVDTANKNSEWCFDYSGCESFQISQYSKGDFYDWHIDGGSDKSFRLEKNYIRKLTVVLSLSDNNDYEGGKFQIDIGLHKKIQVLDVPELNNKGGLLVMPSFLYHRVTPVTKGTRYSLVGWIVGEPFK